MGKIFYIFGKSSTGKDTIYDVSVNEHPQIVLYKEGEPITFEYIAGEGLQTVTGLQ